MSGLRQALARQWRAWRQRLGGEEPGGDAEPGANCAQTRARFWAQFREGQRLAAKNALEAAALARRDA